MTNMIVIAELSKGTIHASTAELVTAAHAYGGEPILVVPCTDASIADSVRSLSGVSKIIAVKSDIFGGNDSSGWASALDTVIPSGTVLCLATTRSKDVAARLAARRNISVVQDVVGIDGTNLTSPIYSGKANQTVSVSTTDNDTAGFTIAQSGGSTSVSESGTTDTFTLVLNAQPDSNVVFIVSSSDTGEATVNTPFTFSTENWNTPRTVTVTGADDSIIDGTITSTITVAVVDAAISFK